MGLGRPQPMVCCRTKDETAIGIEEEGTCEELQLFYLLPWS